MEVEQMTRTTGWKNVHVFISSTFNDMHATGIQGSGNMMTEARIIRACVKARLWLLAFA